MGSPTQFEGRGFQEVECPHCHRVTSICVDSWMVAVREDLVLKASVAPSIFQCSNCHITVQVTAMVSITLDCEELQQPEQEKSRGTVVQWHRKDKQ